MAIEDFLVKWKSLYRTSPFWFKRSVGQVYAILPRRIRHGKILQEGADFLNQSQWWDERQLREYQWRSLKSLLSHGYANVPYYRRVLDEAGLKPEDIRSPDDWQRIPLLSKDTVREHKEELVAGNLRHKRVPANTGGSTGEPLELYWERGRTRSLERAFMWRQWAWAGFRCGQKLATIRGQRVKEGLWHYDPIDKNLFINAYNLSPESLALIMAKLRSFKPVAIAAYPSTMVLLALHMKEEGEPPIESVRVLLCGSENIYPDQKELLREVFKARVYSWYGHGESCCLAGYCDKSDYYHVYPEYGYVELIDHQGNLLPWEEGQRGEIVGTTLINNVMPLIRYRTGDIAVVGPPRCVCGRCYPLWERVEGRKQEYIITADGRPISLTSLVFGQHWHAFSHIKQLQFEQNEAGKAILRIARTSAFTEADEAEIREKVLACVRSGLDLSFDYVERIEPTARGKHLFVKQALPLSSAWAGEVVRHE